MRNSRPPSHLQPFSRTGERKGKGGKGKKGEHSSLLSSYRGGALLMRRGGKGADISTSPRRILRIRRKEMGKGGGRGKLPICFFRDLRSRGGKGEKKKKGGRKRVYKHPVLLN